MNAPEATRRSSPAPSPPHGATAGPQRGPAHIPEVAQLLTCHYPTYEDVATKFFEHFAYISTALNGQGLWDEADGFYYDVRRRARSLPPDRLDRPRPRPDPRTPPRRLLRHALRRAGDPEGPLLGRDTGGAQRPAKPIALTGSIVSDVTTREATAPAERCREHQQRPPGRSS